MKAFDFWFSIGSTYTYLTVNRIDDVARDAGVKVDWQPFSVRAIMQEMNNIPFVGKPAKEKYMWRDFQRRAARIGISVEVPVKYPLEFFDRANRIAILAKKEGWCEKYVKATYHYWMQKGLPAGDDANLEKCLSDVGQPFYRVVRLADSKEIKAEYELVTNRAREMGIFGAPTFVVGGKELFWGDDRLEDAIDYWHTTSSD